MKRFKSQTQLLNRSQALRDAVKGFTKVAEGVETSTVSLDSPLKTLEKPPASVQKQQQNPEKTDDVTSDEQLQDLIAQIRQRKYENANPDPAKPARESCQLDTHTLNDYLALLSALRHQQQPTQTLDPLRLRMYLITRQSTTSHNDVFTSAVRLYHKGQFQEAAQLFCKVASEEPHLHYESKFNQATSLFKQGLFAQAKVLFTNLIASNEQFVGRDRRLFYNKAVCELQMGQYKECITTIRAYLRHYKQCYKPEIEVPQKLSTSRVKVKTQFVKLHCHKTSRQESGMHPSYDFEQDKQFVKEIYKLKGFAHLRSDQSHCSDSLVKSARAFQKAFQQDEHQSEEVKRIKRKRKRVQKSEEVVTEVRQSRVTFINYRKKLLGEEAQSDFDNYEEEYGDQEPSQNQLQSSRAPHSQKTDDSQSTQAKEVVQEQPKLNLNASCDFLRTHKNMLTKFTQEGKKLQRSLSQLRLANETLSYAQAQTQVAQDRQLLRRLMKNQKPKVREQPGLFIKSQYYKVPKLLKKPKRAQLIEELIREEPPAEEGQLLAKLRQLDDFKVQQSLLSSTQYELHSRALNTQQHGQSSSIDKMVWRLNAEVDRKFALGSARDSSSRVKSISLSDFLALEDVQKALQQGFNQPDQKIEDLVYSYLQPDTVKQNILRVTSETLSKIKASQNRSELIEALGVVLGMRFMQQFPVNARFQLLKVSEYCLVQEEADFAVDSSEHFWVLLRGTLANPTTTQKIREDSLQQDQLPRLKALEDCHILIFSVEQVHKIVQEHVKLPVFEFLRSMEFFKGFAEFDLQLLAVNVEQKTFRRGQCIQKEAEEPPGLVIVKQGICVLGTHIKRRRNNDNTRSLLSDDFLVLNEIQSGSMFGGRSLIFNLKQSETKSMLTVVAFSGTVDVLLITSGVFQQLHPRSQKIIAEQISQSVTIIEEQPQVLDQQTIVNQRTQSMLQRSASKKKMIDTTLLRPPQHSMTAKSLVSLPSVQACVCSLCLQQPQLNLRSPKHLLPSHSCFTDQPSTHEITNQIAAEIPSCCELRQSTVIGEIDKPMSSQRLQGVIERKKEWLAYKRKLVRSHTQRRL